MGVNGRSGVCEEGTERAGGGGEGHGHEALIGPLKPVAAAVRGRPALVPPPPPPLHPAPPAGWRPPGAPPAHPAGRAAAPGTARGGKGGVWGRRFGLRAHDGLALPCCSHTNCPAAGASCRHAARSPQPWPSPGCPHPPRAPTCACACSCAPLAAAAAASSASAPCRSSSLASRTDSSCSRRALSSLRGRQGRGAGHSSARWQWGRGTAGPAAPQLPAGSGGRATGRRTTCISCGCVGGRSSGEGVGGRDRR